MRISVILAHPDKDSFNHAIAAAAAGALKEKEHEIYFHDLYEEKFDPLLSLEEIPGDAGRVRLYCNGEVVGAYCHDL